jgi:phosphoglycerate dehydrogenase-like enzyme
MQVYPPDELCEMMGASDYVLMALPLTPETHHFVGAAAIAAMRPHGVLINVGRGKNLDEAALIEGVLPQSAVSKACN